MHTDFARGLVYERMSYGGVYYTAAQIKTMSEGIAVFLDDFGMEDLQAVKQQLRAVFDETDTGVEESSVGMVYGYLYAWEQMYGEPQSGVGEMELEDYKRLADRFYAMAGVP